VLTLRKQVIGGIEMNAERAEAYYTYKDYLKWPDYPRYELIDGAPYMMAGASDIHQDVLGGLYSQFRSFLNGKTCRVLMAPYDVRLNENDYDDTVVQPDILVVCDREKIHRNYCDGAPDLVIEILSPSSGRHDRIVKLKRYLRAGIGEYWIVDPSEKSVHVHILNGKIYGIFVYERDEKIPVHTLPGLEIDLNDVFPQDEPETGEEAPLYHA
jgi:Uma2 family endonuclease